MLRAVVLAILIFVVAGAPSGQAQSVLRIRVVLADADGTPMPVPRHALLISDNPPSAAPRLLRTGPDGTVDVRLPPGSYTVESDIPVKLQRNAYTWTQTVTIVAGRDSTLDLTLENAEAEPVSASASDATPGADPWLLLPRWRDSIVSVWTPTTHASGFLIDRSGLIVTNQRVIGAATSIEVQLTRSLKVAARVLAADRARDVAVLWVDPMVIASVPVVPLPCAQAAKPTVSDGDDTFTLGISLRLVKDIESGKVTRVGLHDILWDARLPAGSTGGPVFNAAGDVVGITSVMDDESRRERGESRIVPFQNACDIVASAKEKMKGAAPPAGTPLPVVPERPFPMDALRAAAERRAGTLTPHQITSSDFDVALITPVMTYAAMNQSGADRERTTRASLEAQQLIRPQADFSNWSEYVAVFPPLLMIRVTPRLVEGFWTKVARGAARTQGISIPPIKSFKSRFGRLRAFCGDSEVTPVHPFKLELRTSASETLYEGLYMFDPGALGPHCSSVKLLLYTENEPDQPDTRVVDPKIVEQLWQAFEPYRTQ